MWRVAGGLAIAHGVLLLAGFSQEVAVQHGDSLATLAELPVRDRTQAALRMRGL